jgi:quinol monooxygenase YgiN
LSFHSQVEEAAICEMMNDSNQESIGFPRREFLCGLVLAAGASVITPSLKGRIENAMANKYGLYGKLQAHAGKGKELGDILLKAARLLENAQGCVLYIISKTADSPEGIYVFEVWDTKEDHDNSLKLAGVRELISQAMPLLAGKPEGATFDVLGGKGLN